MSAKRPKPNVPKKPAMATRAVKPTAGPAVTGSGLLPELRELILTTRQSVARGVNAGLTMLYWQVGDRIRRDILQEAARWRLLFYSTSHLAISWHHFRTTGNGYSLLPYSHRQEPNRIDRRSTVPASPTGTRGTIHAGSIRC